MNLYKVEQTHGWYDRYYPVQHSCIEEVVYCFSREKAECEFNRMKDSLLTTHPNWDYDGDVDWVQIYADDTLLSDWWDVEIKDITEHIRE